MLATSVKNGHEGLSFAIFEPDGVVVEVSVLFHIIDISP